MAPKPKTRRKPKPGYDRALKELLLASRDAFLALIAPGVTWVDTLSEELPAGARRADLVWLVEDEAGQRFILHIELQVKLETDQDQDIRERMAEYALRLFRRDHLPVYSIVIFLKPVTTPEPFLAWTWKGKGLRYDFEIIRLWEQPPAVVLETDQYGLWPLAVLMGQGTEANTQTVIEQIAQAPLPRQEQGKLTGFALLFAGMRLTKTMLAHLTEQLRSNPMMEEIWKESTFLEVAADILRPQLEAEGERKMARRMARVALEGRFGPVSDDVLAAIQVAEEAALETIVAHSSTDTLEQMRARLGLS